MKNILISIIATACFFVVSCGTTSSLKPAVSSTQLKATQSYSRVNVNDFSIDPNGVKAGMASKSEGARRDFADLIASELQKTNAFQQVLRNAGPSANTMNINGVITQYDDGNAALRFMIGFGAGSSRFDANVNFSDSSTNQAIGTIKVDKNSYVLGGMLAATQTADSYMPGAAKKVAAEAAKLVTK